MFHSFQAGRDRCVYYFEMQSLQRNVHIVLASLCRLALVHRMKLVCLIIKMHSLESHNSLDTHRGIFLTLSCHSCVIANTNNDMHDKVKNRTRATPSFKMNQIIDPVPLTPLHDKILSDH